MTNKIYLVLQSTTGFTGAIMAGNETPEDAVLEGLQVHEDNVREVDCVPFDEAYIIRTDEELQTLENGRVTLTRSPEAYWTPGGWSGWPFDWFDWIDDAVENRVYDMRELRGELAAAVGDNEFMNGRDLRGGQS